jgi:HlyD family secretion protein
MINWAKDRFLRLGWLKALILVLVVIALLWLIPAYLFPTQIEATTTKHGDVVRTYRSVGFVDADRNAIIAAPISGQINQISVAEGDSVSNGQTLVELVNLDMQSQIRAQKADAIGLSYALNETRANLASAQTRAREAVLKLQRYQELDRRGFVSKADLIAVEATADIAKNDVQRAQAEIARLSQSRSSQNLKVEAGQQQLDQTRLKAPFSGLVTRKLRQNGEIATVGSTIIEIIDPSSLNVILRFNAAILSQIRIGDRINISFSHTEATVPATIARISRLVDQDTDEVDVTAHFIRKPQRWALGQRVTGQMQIIESRSALILPERYVVKTSNGNGVWIADAGRAVWREVKIGKVGDHSVEIIDGLKLNDQVLMPQGQFSWRRITPVLGR